MPESIAVKEFWFTNNILRLLRREKGRESLKKVELIIKDSGSIIWEEVHEFTSLRVYELGLKAQGQDK